LDKLDGMKIRMLLGVMAGFVLVNAARAAEPVRLDLFKADSNGYATYRIPGVVVTAKGTVLVYCEARKSAKSDWGEIDVLMRRSTDGGRTFDAPRKMVAPPAPAPAAEGKPAVGVTVNNPLAIADPSSGAIHFFYCINYARCFVMRSDDDGVTFSKPVEITGAFEELRAKFDWKVIATGPGHGIRLQSGRLLVPVWLALQHSHRPSCVSTIYSDDAGKSWHAGEIVVTHSKQTPNPSESVAVELKDGRVMMNIRNESPSHRRLVSISKDGISGWSQPTFDQGLFDPICMASMIRRGDELLFLNPAGDGKSKVRSNLTLQVSRDSGKTWTKRELLEPGVGAYSDMALPGDGGLLTFYECGGVNGQQFYIQSLRLTKLERP
jgi:sialidase-1